MDYSEAPWLMNPDEYTKEYFDGHFKDQVINNPDDVIWIARWVGLHHRSWLTEEEWEKCEAHFKPYTEDTEEEDNVQTGTIVSSTEGQSGKAVSGAFKISFNDLLNALSTLADDSEEVDENEPVQEEGSKGKSNILYERPGITIELMKDDEEDEGDKLTSSKEESKEKQKDDPIDSNGTYETTLSGGSAYDEMPDDVD